MSKRTLFIGDSHTCGYKSIPGKKGEQSYSYWNDNNYAEIYSSSYGKNVSIYSMAGVNNRVYTNWLKTLVDLRNDADELFLCLAPLNRFCIGFDPVLSDEAVPINNFTHRDESSTEQIERFYDVVTNNDKIQLFNKPTVDDYSNFPGLNFDIEKGLIKPDLRKNSFMEIKLFFDLNSFIEKRDFLLNLFAWDRICEDHNIKSYVFYMVGKSKYPSEYDYYGKLKNTKVSPMSVEEFFQKKFVDHKKYLIEDNEHYNYEYHKMIAENFIPWLKEK